MKFGIATFVNDDSIDPVSLARAIEDRGFESPVVAEHTHIPASRESPYPAGGELPPFYYRTLDPFVTLAAAAAVTSKIELFTGIALLIQRDPITTAKEAASIDQVSGGRLVFGVGAGVIAGVLLGMFRFLADVASPYIKIANAIPRIVLGSLFTVALGLGTPSKVALASVLVFFVVFFNAFQGVREVDRNLLANARVLGASKPAIIRHVVVPSALVWIIASLHVAFGFAIIGAIVGEFLGSQKGLGLVIATAQNQFDPNGVFAAMLIIAVIALTAEWLISLLERRLLSWRPQQQAEAAAA